MGRGYRTCLRAAAALGACVALALAGCGGSSARESAYAATGNAICAQELARLNRLPRPITPAQAVSYLPQAIVIIRREAIRLQALQPPAARHAALGNALFSARRLAALLNHFLLQLKGGTVELGTFAQVQTQSEALRGQINRHFLRAGLPGCVSS